MDPINITGHIPCHVARNLQAYLDLHPDLPADEAIAHLLELGLRRADKATVHIPVELLADLQDCASHLHQIDFQAIEPVILQSIKDSAHRVYDWSKEYWGLR